MMTVLVLVVAPAGAAPAAQGDTTLASTSDDGTKANVPFVGAGTGARPSLSQDGTRIAFESRATNLDPGDTDDDTDVYVKDLATGNMILASATDAGASANGWLSAHPSIAGDGRTVAFHSVATNLDTADTDGTLDIYVKDLSSLDVTVVGTGDLHGYCGGFGGNQLPSLSADGATLSFESRDPLDFTLDSSGNYLSGELGDCDADVFVKNLVSGALTRVSVPEGGGEGDGDSWGSSLSADGSKVAFISAASNLVAGDVNGVADVFVKDLVSGAVQLASSAADGAPADGGSATGAPSLSADGTTVAFTSRATNLDAADTEPDDDVYVKDLGSGAITLASSSDSGEAATVGAAGPALSDDGSRVAFYSTATNLDPADGDGLHDVYVKDLATGDISLASTNDAGEKGNGRSYETALSGDGGVVGFASEATNLDAVDSDTAMDSYVKVLGSSGDPDADGDGVVAGADQCPELAEDADGVQDSDGCPEEASHDVAVTAVRTSGRVDLGRCLAPCSEPIVIKIKNFGSHAQTDVPFQVTGTGDSGRSYAGCSGNAAALSPDGDLDPREAVTVPGCAVSYLSRGSAVHEARVDHGSNAQERLSDGRLDNNARVDRTTVS